MTGTLASRAFLIRAWSAGMLAAHCGRVVQVGLMMSSTTRAVVFGSRVTAAGAGIAGARFGFAEGEADGGAAVGAAVVAAGSERSIPMFAFALSVPRLSAMRS